MDLRPRPRQSFSGFFESEVAKMDQLIDVYKDKALEDEFCKKLARLFNRSSGRAGKPVVKWTEVQRWFQTNQHQDRRREAFSDDAKKLSVDPETLAQNKATGNQQMPEGDRNMDLSQVEFEARSSKDGAWYDVDTFHGHKFLSSGEAELLVKYVGFGTGEAEWVNARDSVRVRSIPLEHSDCQKVKVGDLVVCFQEVQDQAKYYDAHVLEIQRRWHDVRGCRCLFLIRYDHDNAEERVRLRRLCCRPTIGAKLK